MHHGDLLSAQHREMPEELFLWLLETLAMVGECEVQTLNLSPSPPVLGLKSSTIPRDLLLLLFLPLGLST